MAEGDSLGPGFSLPNFNSTELLNLFSQEGGESLTNLFGPLGSSIGDNFPEPELEILEQPKQRGFRFRYSCEGPSHGGLPGEHSTKGRKSYPSVQINNYAGKARIEVTLVTASDPPQPHAHSLVGKNVRDGACLVEVGPENGMTASFPNLGIQHVTKKNVKNVLKERYLKRRHPEEFTLPGMTSQAMNVDVDPTAGPSHEATDRKVAEAVTREEMTKIDQLVEAEAKHMNLSTVRLSFQTYIPNEQGNFVNCLKPVYSNPIFDSKAAAASELKICRIHHPSGYVQGGDEVIILCDKVQKEDIEVRFFDTRENGTEWEGFGKFAPSDVHRQFAIVFKTPEYWNLAIEKPVAVNIELRRRSDQETSAPVEFTYKPTEFDPEQIGAKRRKKVPHFNDFDQPSSSGGDFGASSSTTAPAPAAMFNPLSSIFGTPGFFPNPSLFPGFSAAFPGGPGFSGLPQTDFLAGASGSSPLGQSQSPDDEPSQSNRP